ncbi:hypothetical protein DJ68_17395 [Halorubrum sp. C3]|nr:hypothetical protein DJ68_17395 [Halorubrum sp. C3]
MDDTPEFTDRQREFLSYLPATSKEIADKMGISNRGVRDHRENVEDKGVDLDYDETTHIWSRADDPGGQEDTTLPEEPDPSDLTERERYILHQLQTATDTEELAEARRGRRPERAGHRDVSQSERRRRHWRLPDRPAEVCRQNRRMMYQAPIASHQFDTDTVSVVTTEGEASPLAFYDPSSTQAWLAMDNPLDLRDYR